MLSTFFRFLAREIRETLAETGVRKLDEIIGRTDMLFVKAGMENGKTAGLDFSRLLHMPEEAQTNAIINVITQKHDIDRVLDREIISRCYPAIESGMPVELEFPICNTDRSVGAMLSGVIAKNSAITDFLTTPSTALSKERPDRVSEHSRPRNFIPPGGRRQ